MGAVEVEGASGQSQGKWLNDKWLKMGVKKRHDLEEAKQLLISQPLKKNYIQSHSPPL